MMFLEKKLKL